MQPKCKITIDELIRSDRRTVCLQVEGSRLIVRAPKRASLEYINECVAGRADWILSKQEKQSSMFERYPPHAYIEGEKFLFMGEPLTLFLSEDAKTARLLRDGICAPKKDAQKHVERYYRKKAKELFCERTALYAEKIGVTPNCVKLSSAKKRWGSCSGKNAISYTWKLICAPIGAVDYVVVHELCHILQKNHSAEFWRLVQKNCPDYKAQRKWLKDNQALLTQ